MQKITSRDNQKLKLARKTRDGKADGLIFVEGLRLAEEALRAGTEIAEAFFAEGFPKGERAANLYRSLEEKNLPLSELPARLFDSIADTQTSQGVALLCRRPEASQTAFAKAFKQREAALDVVLLLHRINNPANLGAVLRTAEAVDVAGVIVTRNSADVFSPKALRASMGAALRLAIWENAAFRDALEWARDAGLISIAADIRARKSYTEIDWRRGRLLVFGSEAHGLDEAELREIDESLIVPMANEVESLNLAVSCAVVLFEAKRQNETQN